MSSIREIARYYLDDARDGIQWIAVWKIGRSWEAKNFCPADISRNGVPTWEDEDLETLREIAAADPHAVILNSYYHNLGDTEEMTAENLARFLRWQYEDIGGMVISDYLPETAQEETIAVRVKVYNGCKYESESEKIADVDYMVKGYEVKRIPPDEILKEYDETDEYNEYLILTLADGETATFRNSRVDLFRL